MKMVLAVLLSVWWSTAAFGWLGDTLDAAEARYGLEKPDPKVNFNSKLLEDAREVRFEHAGWKIRCALLKATDGKDYIVREEYSKIWNAEVMKAGGAFQIRDFERDAVLKAQPGTWVYHTIAPAGSDPASAAFNQILRSAGRSAAWVRQEDGAVADVTAGAATIVFDHPLALKHEAEWKAARDLKQRQNAQQIISVEQLSSAAAPTGGSSSSAFAPAVRAAAPALADHAQSFAPTPPPAPNPAPAKTPANSGSLKFLIGCAVVLVALKEFTKGTRRRKKKRADSPPAATPAIVLPRPISSSVARVLNDLSWDDFELLLGEIYRRQGFEVELCAGTGADGGIDLTLRKDGAHVLVQCKSRTTSKVTAKDVREFFGVMVSEKADRGIFATTSDFTRDARDFADGKNIEMLDGQAVERLLRQAAISPEENLLDVERWAPAFFASAKLTHPQCPFCKTPMVKRDSRAGVFWGCSGYPRCRGKREVRKQLR